MGSSVAMFAVYACLHYPIHTFPATPGNIWWASCQHIARLADPLRFETEMNLFIINRTQKGCHPSWLGFGWTDRQAPEHWILRLSHPAAVAADVLPARTVGGWFTGIRVVWQARTSGSPSCRYFHALTCRLLLIHMASLSKAAASTAPKSPTADASTLPVPCKALTPFAKMSYHARASTANGIPLRM